MDQRMYRTGEEVAAVVVEQQPADAINAQDLCPLLWSLLEDTAAQGFISPGEWKTHLVSCRACQVKLLEVMKTAVEGMELDAATRMFMRTVLKKAQQMVEELQEKQAEIDALQKSLTEGQTQ